MLWAPEGIAYTHGVDPDWMIQDSSSAIHNCWRLRL